MHLTNQIKLLFVGAVLIGSCDKQSDEDRSGEVEPEQAKKDIVSPSSEPPKAAVNVPTPTVIPEVPTEGWKRRAFSPHGFFVEAPGEPRVNKSEIMTEHGKAPMETTSLSRPGVQGTLAVAITTFPIPEGVDPNIEQALKEAATTTLGGGKALRL